MSYFDKSIRKIIIILIIVTGPSFNLFSQNNITYSIKRGGKPLTELSEKQKEKTKLLYVNVKGGEYKFPDETIIACKNLETLFINGEAPRDEENWFKNYDDYTIIKFDTKKLKKLSNIKNFGFSFVSIDKVFENISVMTSITSLEINFTNMDSISDDIEKLVNLETLSLSTNQISFVSDKIGSLKNLKRVNLSNNALIRTPLFSQNNSILEIIDLNNGNQSLLQSKYLPINKIDYLNKIELEKLKKQLEEISSLKNVYISTSLKSNGKDLKNKLEKYINNKTLFKKVKVSEPMTL